jgi:hypothetical protein
MNFLKEEEEKIVLSGINTQTYTEGCKAIGTPIEDNKTMTSTSFGRKKVMPSFHDKTSKGKKMEDKTMASSGDGVEQRKQSKLARLLRRTKSENF